MNTGDPTLAPEGFDRILALEDDARQLRRDLDEAQEERRALARRLLRLEERLVQAESDVKDAHDRAQNAEDRVAILEDVIDERELGESGA